MFSKFLGRFWSRFDRFAEPDPDEIELPERHILAPMTDLAALQEDAEEGEVPEFIAIAPIGTFTGRGRMGTFSLQREFISKFVRNTRKESKLIMVDIGHESIFNAGAEAMAWIAAEESSFRIHRNQLEAKFEFTPKGRELVANKSFRFVSPVLEIDRPELEEGEKKVLSLQSVALTNRPALKLRSINSQRPPEAKKMDRDKIIKKLGLSSDATDDQIFAAMSAAPKTAPITPTVDPSIADFVPRASFDTLRAEHDVLVASNATRDEADHKAKVDTAIKAALAAGTITPATEKYYRGQCKDAAGLAAFAAFVPSAPVIGDDAGVSGAVDPNAAPGTLSADEKTLTAHFSTTDEEFLASKKQIDDLGVSLIVMPKHKRKAS